MTGRPLATIALLVAISAYAPALARAQTRIQVTYDTVALDGTCTLIDVAPHGNDVQLSFVTSLRLFKSVQGPFLPPREIELTLDDGRRMLVPRDGVILPSGNMIDIALLRVVAPAGSYTPTALAATTPAIGSTFEILGYDAEDDPMTMTAHVRFASTALVVGDRDASALAGCVGAPAVGSDGVFGIVSECDPHRAAVIARLSMSYAFLGRYLPGLLARPTDKEQR
jgi:hypothetical protein